MINHIRTLLLNKSSAVAGPATGIPACEYVPADFGPVAVPTDILPVRAALRLDDSNVFRLNHTLAWLMRLLHAPEFAPYTQLFDPRVTYDFTDDSYRDLRMNYVTVDDYGSSGAVRLEYGHSTYATLPDALKNLAGPVRWRVRRLGDSAVAISVNDGDESYIRVQMQDGRSHNIALVEDYLYIYLVSDTGALDQNFMFEVTINIPTALAAVPVLDRLRTLDASGGITAALFLPWADYAEEIAALGTIWRHSPEHTAKLAACALGYAYRIERQRRGVVVPTRESTLRRYAT